MGMQMQVCEMAATNTTSTEHQAQPTDSAFDEDRNEADRYVIQKAKRVAFAYHALQFAEQLPFSEPRRASLVAAERKKLELELFMLRGASNELAELLHSRGIAT